MPHLFDKFCNHGFCLDDTAARSVIFIIGLLIAQFDIIINAGNTFL